MRTVDAARMAAVTERVTYLLTLPPAEREALAGEAVCRCGHPQGEHAGKAHGGACRVCDTCPRYSADVIDAYAHRVVAADRTNPVDDFKAYDRAHADRDPMEPGQIRVRPSDAGGCKRQVWYRNFTPDDVVLAPVPDGQATMGTSADRNFTAARAWLYPWRLHKHKVTIPGLDRRGEVDEFDPITGVLSDYKTAGGYKWDRLGDDGPTDATWAQLLVYAVALTRAGHTVRLLRLLYVHREDGRHEWFERTYDPAEGAAALRDLTRLATTLDTYRAAVEAGDTDVAEATIPAREGTGPTRFPCSYCPYRLHCWDVDAAEAAGRSPESWVALGPSPEEAAVATTLGEYAAAREAEKAGATGKELAKSWLDGIDPGRYGDYTLRVASRTVDDHKAYAQALAAAYDLPEGFRPPLDSITMPKRTTEWLDVRKVRQAVRDKEAAERAAQDKESTDDTP